MLLLDFPKFSVIIFVAWQRSSVVEQRNHNPLVGGPNPSAATRINKRPIGSFFYSVHRCGDGHPDGGPTRRQKADGSMPAPRSFNEGEFAQGNDAQRNQSLRCYPTSPPCGFVGQAKFWPDFRLFCFVKISRFCPNLSVLADIFTYTGHRKLVCCGKVWFFLRRQPRLLLQT